MKCILEYENGHWYCSCADLYPLVQRTKPDDDIRAAITAFHSRYYPDEQARSKDYPWVLHSKANPTKGSGDRQSKERLKTEIGRHELTWHWRLLLPCLRQLQPRRDRGYDIVLCVSQIRQWQLVSCFKMKWPAGSGQELLRQIRDATKTLLRPPVFGKSHRITRYEVYAAFYEPSVRRQISAALSAAAHDDFRRAHVLGRHDSYFRLTNIKCLKGRYHFDVEHVIDLEPEQAPLKLGEESVKGVCRPYGLANIPLFGQSASGKLPKPLALLLASDNYCRAFEKISDVLNDPDARSILLIAPPGSGKEDIGSILHECRRHHGNRVVVNLAGLDEESAAFRLFHLEQKRFATGFERGDVGWQLKMSFKPDLRDGALFQALRGTLVIDELDKARDSVRSMLLRFLENDEAVIPDTAVTIKIPRELRPLYVFAGSMARKEFLQLAPIDFWSRITHIIEMQHPLALVDSADKLRVAEDYVRLFWLRQVEAFFNGENLLKKSRPLYEPLRVKFLEWGKFFADRAAGDFVAQEMAEVLCGPGQPTPSVRTLRETAARCFDLLFQALLYHKQSRAPLEEWRKSLTGEPSSELRKFIEKMISSSARSGNLPHKAVDAVGEMRKLIRSSASIRV